MINVSLVSLGCDKNTVDSEAILYLFNDKNKFKIISNLDESDVIIINTCAFILDAKTESLNEIFTLRNKYQDKKIVVVGCLSSRYEKELKEELTEADLIVSFKDYDKLGDLVASLFNENSINKFDIFNRVLSTPPYFAYLKIGEGCSNYCGFCAIPFIRGPLHSYDFNSLIEESKKLAKNGVKELVIVSQDTGKYGTDLKDNDINIVSLLREIDKIEGFEFIKILYLYPNEVTDELLDLIKGSNKIVPYFDIPIQHSSTKVLKSMLRKDTREDLISLYKRIKDKLPESILRTTLLVGYPGETESDFNDLKEFIQEIKFNHLGVFTYSKEEGTYAYNLKDQVDDEIKIKRRKELLDIQSHISYNLNKELIGKTFKSIVTRKVDDLTYDVRNVFNLSDEIDGKVTLKLKSNVKLNEGDIINVRITHAFIYDLVCEIKEE